MKIFEYVIYNYVVPTERCDNEKMMVKTVRRQLLRISTPKNKIKLQPSILNIICKYE